jgi:putative transposase
MPSSRINDELKNGCYFVTPTIWNWYYIFDRHDRWQILADSITYCQENKGLEVFAYVFMLNHAHMVIRSPDVSGFLRDFKRHTSTKLKENIEKTEPNVIDLFIDEDENYKFWKPDNKPKLIEEENFALQKINYIHNNPVVKGYVTSPEHWKWSSAHMTNPIKLTSIW